MILLIINSGVYWFTKEKISITVTPSSYINNEYVTVVSLKNFQNNKSISEINFWFNDTIIKKVDTELKNEIDYNNVKVDNILPDYTGNIVIYSEKEISEQNLKVELNEKYNLVFISSQKESAYIQIINYLGTALIYFIEFAIMLYLYKKFTNRKIKEQERKIEETERAIRILKQDQETTMKEAKRINKRIMKNKLLFARRLSDYSRELNFWKDTIRKILYRVSKEDMKKNDICEIVTDNLRTYRTKEKCEYFELEDIIEEFKDDKKEE